jgi:hypothetical protein
MLHAAAAAAWRPEGVSAEEFAVRGGVKAVCGWGLLFWRKRAAWHALFAVE